MTINMITAREALEQGTSAAQVASIAAYSQERNPKLAAAVRRIAEEVAALTGVKLYGKRGHYVPSKARRAKPANDNRKKRRAA